VSQVERDGDDDVLPEVEALVRKWLAVAAEKPSHRSASRLAQVLRDPQGLGFTVGFVDRVIRPEDPGVAADSLRRLVRSIPRFVPPHLAAALRLGAAAAPVAPGVVVPLARRALRRMVGHLLIDAGDAALGRAIARLRAPDVRLNLNLLGEAVLGSAEASRRLDGTRRLLQRPDVDYVSIKVSAAVAPHSPWAFAEAVHEIEDALLPLFTLAAQSATPKFINLDMEEYRDLDLTISVFTSLLDRPELLGLEAGIVLQAYLPDALGAMFRLQQWAAARRARGGAGIKVRLVKGANLPMEKVESSLHGWPLATWGSKQETDTNYKRVLRYALMPERVANVRIGVAGHNLFDIAYAWTLANRRGVSQGVEFEMLLGMAEGQAAAVRETVGGLLLYVPVVHPRDFDAAIAYLVRRLEEGASSENFMSAVFALHENEALYVRERDRFIASLAALDDEVPEPNRAAVVEPRAERTRAESNTFTNTPDVDPAVAQNRQWAREILQRVPTSILGVDLVREHTITDADTLAATIEAAADAGTAWGARPAAERAAILGAAAVEFERRRADLLEVMAAECGKTLDQSDPEVSEAIDFLHHYAECAEDLDHVDGAIAAPVRLTVVTPPWNFPVAIPTGSTVAALAAGSAVIIKPATQARRCGSMLVETLWSAGIPREVLRLVHVEEGDLGRRLVAHPAVDRLILTGAYETAELFRSFRPDLQLLAETSGKNSIVITPHADLDLAVKDLVNSAFSHAGQKCSAASLAILVGSVGTSRRFHDQLVDAASSLNVAYPDDPTAQLGPLIEPPTGKLEHALTTLAPGERWLLEPRRLDDSGRLWSPGVKTGVARGSQFHRTEYFGPVLGLIHAADLEEAIAIQNEVDYGLTAGLHSLDRGEIERWLARVQAGNVYINRGITGALVRRQPFGGWKRSSVGAGTKAGGPNYLFALTDWRPARAGAGAAVGTAVQRLLDAAALAGLTPDDLAFVVRGAESDALAWREEFGLARDVSGLLAEHNWLRYTPVPVTVRYEGARPAELFRVVAAGLTAGAAVRVSTATAIDVPGVTVAVQDAAAWQAWLRGCGAGRVRLIGGDRESFAAASRGRADLALYAQPVVESGRVEGLAFVREQAVSATGHRFGSPTTLTDGLM